MISFRFGAALFGRGWRRIQQARSKVKPRKQMIPASSDGGHGMDAAELTTYASETLLANNRFTAGVRTGHRMQSIRRQVRVDGADRFVPGDGQPV
jgi:hypothetical protein